MRDVMSSSKIPSGETPSRIPRRRAISAGENSYVPAVCLLVAVVAESSRSCSCTGSRGPSMQTPACAGACLAIFCCKGPSLSKNDPSWAGASSSASGRKVQLDQPATAFLLSGCQDPGSE